MAIVHMVHGYLGAGKTTFAKRLERELRAVRFSPDEWMVALYGHDPPAEHFAGYLERVFAVVHATWPRVTRVGADVILDFGFWTRRLRDHVRGLAAEHGATTRLYALSCADDTARARCQQRNLDLGGSLFISPETFDVLRARFEPLAGDEPHEVIVTDGSGEAARFT
jgi:predicted kinase